MPISLPNCDLAERLPLGIGSARCARCQRAFGPQSADTTWVYCDRPDPGSCKNAPSIASHTTDLIEELGRYTIGEELGRGGMGLVLAAHDTVLGRGVALKVQIAGPMASETARRRFATELQTLANLRVNGVARVLDGGVTTLGMAWYVMERVHGPTLDDVLADAMYLSRDEALRIISALSRTLQRVHAHGVAHRDIKPSNVLLTLLGEPVLVDFGLVTPIQRPTEPEDRLTRDVVGTPLYMAPEQTAAHWDDIDWVKVDVYALGMMLIETLTGVLPPAALPTLELLPESIQRVCAQATHADPRKRFATPAELADAIDAARRERWWHLGRPKTRTPMLLGAAVLVALAIPGTMLVRAQQDHTAREGIAAERLDATWARISGLSVSDPDVDATFRAFIDDPQNHDTQAWRDAWRRRAETSADPDTVIESWATAWISASAAEERHTALAGLVAAFEDQGRWEALDALLVDTPDAELRYSGLDPIELRISVAIQALRLDEARALMSPDDPRRQMTEHFRHVQSLDLLDGFLIRGATQGWMCAPQRCVNGDGRSLEGPITTMIDGGPVGALFYRENVGFIREDGSTLCELPWSRVVTGTYWNGTLVVATGGQDRRIVRIDTETCETTTLQVDGDMNNWVTTLVAVDLVGDAARELVITTGASYGYEIIALSSDGTQVLDRRTLGDIRDLAVTQVEGRIGFAVALSDFHVSPYFFPKGAAVGVQLLTWEGEGFSEPELLRHPVINTMDAWMVSSGDIDADGDVDLAVTHANAEGSLTVWTTDGDQRVPVFFGRLSSAQFLQLDHDAPMELVATIDGRAIALGLGNKLYDGRPRPQPTGNDAPSEFATASRLRRLGLLERSAEEAERIARTLASAQAVEAWNTAGQAWLDGGRPSEAARTFAEAARLGDANASPRAIDAYMSAWDLKGALRYATRTGLPTRAPTDVHTIAFDTAPDASIWLDADVSQWEPNHHDVLIEGVSGLGTVLRIEVERRSDVYGVEAALLLERLEWGAELNISLLNPVTGERVHSGMIAHGGDGELYRSGHVQGSSRYMRDDNPAGPHDVQMTLTYDQQQGLVYAALDSDGERYLDRDRPFTFDAETLILEVSLPFEPEVDAAGIRARLKTLTLYGLVPTGRAVGPPAPTDITVRAHSFAYIRSHHNATADLPLTVRVDRLRSVFEPGMHMHPEDPELAMLAVRELGVMQTDAAIAQAPYLALLYADSLLNAGQTETARSIYLRATDDTEPHIAVLAWAGLAAIADLRGEDTRPLIAEARRLAPTLAVGDAWIRRRRLAHLLDR